MNKPYFLLVGLLLIVCQGIGQVTLNPPFVTQNDTVEIIFDATQGNGALTGVSPVYAHTGVITNLSSSPTDWRHVQGNWGTADPKVLMTSLGNNLHSLKFHINSFYSVPSNETVQALAFVFRNANGSVVGRASGGGDIFVPISVGGFQAAFTTPSSFGIYSVNDSIDLKAQCSDTATIKLYHQNTLLAQVSNDVELAFKLPLVNYGVGRFDLIMEATSTSGTYYDTVSYVARSGANYGFDTSYFEEGITIINDSSIALKVRAPYKDFIYVIGDFNNWQVDPDYEMFESPSDDYFWIVIDDLDPAKEYAFQYYIDEEGLLVGDAYSEKILDPWNDQYISNSVYPNLKSFPSETSYPVSVVQTVDPNPYQWANTSFEKPKAEELNIYELLIRDFDSRHTYKSVIDRLDYLQEMGINAIEFMPVMEFEGNESWGYNPMFFMAPDKYYGTANDLKELIDSCHSRGMAVIFDIAMNHAFGQCPLVRMYFDGSDPTSQSPWFNVQAKHDFNVGYDFNHASAATKYFVKRVYQHWVEEYKIDGYRVDLSKGYTQKNTLGNTAAFANYDQSRINILQEIKDYVNEVDTSAIMILEHFADNNEEVELSNRGFLLWGNENHQYNEASMGYASSLSGIYHANRGWSSPGLVGYMESHDEERLMYKNLNFGNSAGSYDITDTAVALDRVALDAAFFFTVPGPKMIWQFGELGYNFSINRCTDGTIDANCRLSNKPIRWDFFTQPDRRDLYSEFSNLMHLRNTYSNVFQSSNANMMLSGFSKSISLQSGDSAAVVFGNFDMTSKSVIISFPQAGWWYDYHSGDSVLVTSTLDTTYEAGEYHVYLNFKAKAPNNISLVEQEKEQYSFEIYPNPVHESVVISGSPNSVKSMEFTLYDVKGVSVLERSIHLDEWSSGKTIITGLGELSAGVYFYTITSDVSYQSGKLVIE